MIYIYISSQIFFFSLFLSSISTESMCGEWEAYKDIKCIKIIDDSKVVSYDDAVKLCSQNSSNILNIHSKEEQEFVSKFLFETHKIVNDVWLGLKNENKTFKWTDGSALDYTEWTNGSPSNRTDYNCAQMLAESTPAGQWKDASCTKKNVVVCQKTPTTDMSSLQNSLLETKRQLNDAVKKLDETYSKLNGLLTNLLSNKFINYKLFTDTDGTHKAFFLPLGEKGSMSQTWDQANETCAKLSASLVEIHDWRKQFIFNSFWSQSDVQFNGINDIWLNGRKDPSGKWMWITSGKEINYANWGTNMPRSQSNYDYINAVDQSGASVWYNNPKSDHHQVICETVVNF